MPKTGSGHLQKITGEVNNVFLRISLLTCFVNKNLESKYESILIMKKLFIQHIFLFFLANNTLGGNVLNVKAFGAKGDGKTDDTQAIQKAINSANPLEKTTIFFPDGNYIIGSYTTTTNYWENYCLLFYSNIDFKGTGPTSIITLGDHLFDKSDTSANAHIFKGLMVKNISFSNITIDMNGGNNLVPPKAIKNHSAIFIIEGENIHIANLTIKNCAGSNMIDIMGRGKNLLIENSIFLNGGNYVGISKANSNQYDFSFIYSEWDSTIVKNNFIAQENLEIALENYSGGIELHGSFCAADNNTITGCLPAVYITSIKENLKVSVTNNKMIDCVIGINFWLSKPTTDILIKDNFIQLTHSRFSKVYLSTGIQVPNGNLSEYNKDLANGAAINQLNISGNTITAENMKNLSVGMILHSVHNGKVDNNIVSGMNYAGILMLGSKWGMNSLKIQNNHFILFRPNNDVNAVGGYMVITDTYSRGRKEAAGFKNILIRRNTFSTNSLPGSNAVKPKGQFFKSFIDLPAKFIKEIQFLDNQFSSNSGNFMILPFKSK